MVWNRTKTLILLSALTALFLWIGHALGGQGGMMLALKHALIPEEAKQAIAGQNLERILAEVNYGR